MARKRDAGPDEQILAELRGIGFGGFRIDARSGLDAMTAAPGLQVVKSTSVFGLAHLASAVRLARRSHAEGKNRARDLRTEFLLFITGERQVVTALRAAGLGEGEGKVVAVDFSGPDSLEAIAQERGWRRDDALIGADGKDLRGAGFSDREIRVASDALLLPLERTALLAVRR